MINRCECSELMQMRNLVGCLQYSKVTQICVYVCVYVCVCIYIYNCINHVTLEFSSNTIKVLFGIWLFYI